MKQMNYLFRSVDQAIGGLATIRDFSNSHPHADALLIMFSSGVETADMTRLLRALDAALPDVKRAGISEYLYAFGGEDPSAEGTVRMNLMLSDQAAFDVMQIPCEPGGEEEAAEKFARTYAETGDVKGVALFPANAALNVTTFLQHASMPPTLHGVPFFGAMAALDVDSFVHEPLGGSYGIGDALVVSGFTAAVFRGENLQVYMDYVLGWRPVGGEMTPVLGTPLSIGEGCIRTIDKQPALEVYDKYLGVKWGENFVLNVCEFPLLVNHNDVDICMVPISAGDEGELYFSGQIFPGDKIRFSYGTRESVVGASQAGSERMRDFDAQAVIMALCGNRALFLGDEAHVEWDLYRAANPQLAFCHGHYEIAWLRGCAEANRVEGEGEGTTCDAYDETGRGGVLTSALVAVGLREGPRERPAGSAYDHLGHSGGAAADNEHERTRADAPGEPVSPDAPVTPGALVSPSTPDAPGAPASPTADADPNATRHIEGGGLAEPLAPRQADNASSSTTPAAPGSCNALTDNPQASIAQLDGRDILPLSYRLSRFFDVMTGELVHLQHNLEAEVERKTRENENLMLHVVITLAAAIDAKDAYTNGHSSRVALYSREIARRAGYSEDRQQEIYVMGILHDVGKIGVPDSIITKPGRLTDEEFAVIKTHPATGARILAAIEEMPGLAVGAHWHHERYDGHGYPDGLAGENIPEEARIIAVADAYDAMTSNRSYRDAMPQEKVREQFEIGRGTQFDPRFADVMIAMIDEDADYRMRELRP